MYSTHQKIGQYALLGLIALPVLKGSFTIARRDIYRVIGEIDEVIARYRI